MKESYYFSHDYTARTDPKIKKLIMKHGMSGYGLFWAIIEDLYQNTNVLRLDYDSISFDLRTDIETIKSIINDFELFEINGDNFSSLSVQRRLDERNKKSAKARESISRRWKKTKENTNVLRTEYECNTIKGKERKEKEINNDISFNKEIVFNFKKEFLKIGLQEKFINEWLKIRKAKKLVNTETAFKKFLTEYQKTDMEINSLFENYIIPKSWGGFESEWLNKETKVNGNSNNNSGNNKQAERIKQNIATATRLAEKYEREGITINPMGK